MKVDYLIIGAGMAGLTLKHFLKNERTVLLDPAPGGYKVGESVIPETFRHPELKALLPAVRELPSYSKKKGTLFISPTSVASFPIPTRGRELSMHVARHELEDLLRTRWQLDVECERVEAIDFRSRRVTTNRRTYQVRHQILDCSGPAMVVARAAGVLQEAQPVYATWAYLDIEGTDFSRYQAHLQQTGQRLLRYDGIQGRVLPGEEEPGWEPSHTTVLTQLEEGLWSWQIPLFRETLLSFGLVSRKGKIDADTLFDWVEKSHCPHYALKRRPRDRTQAYDRVHTRNRFAQVASTAATLDAILVSDAAAFGDPVYSVGTGVAVNKAIEVAALLNEGGWTPDKCARYCADQERMMKRALAAFEQWYSGQVLNDEQAATEVQENFLLGNTFQVGIATHYSQVLVDAAPAPSHQDIGRLGPSPVQHAPPGWVNDVRTLLPLDGSNALVGWHFEGPLPLSNGVQLRWSRENRPELIMLIRHISDATRYYRRVGEVTLAFMNLWDGPYPLDEYGRALFDALEVSIEGQNPAWLALFPKGN